MQRVIHEYTNKSVVFGLIEGLYAWMSDDKGEFDDILWLDETFRPLCNILEENLLEFVTPTIKNLNLSKISYPKMDTKKEVTVCFSGGKDSAACAYYYKKHGYTVHLYHATGVNKAYGDEKKAAEALADYLGCDLFVEKIELMGHQPFTEHPLKNYIIANGALHYAMAMGYAPVIAFGNFNKSSVDDNVFDVCGGDCIEMWDAYKVIVQNVLPDFDLQVPLETNADTFNLLTEDLELFRLSVSCMSPYRFREHWKHRTEEKYNVRLFDNRCGCCWKCAVESIWLMDTDQVWFNRDYYAHCFDILERTVFKETGSPARSIKSVWDNYMFYPIEQSKLFPDITHRKIKKVFK